MCGGDQSWRAGSLCFRIVHYLSVTVRFSRGHFAYSYRSTENEHLLVAILQWSTYIGQQVLTLGVLRTDLTLLDGGGGRPPPWRYQPPFCGGCTNQFQMSSLFPITSLLSSDKVIFPFFCSFYKKIPFKFFFNLKMNDVLTKMAKNIFLSQILAFLSTPIARDSKNRDSCFFFFSPSKLLSIQISYFGT